MEVQSVRPLDRIEEVLLLPPTAASQFRDLSAMLEALTPDDPSGPLPIREYEKRFREWRNNAPKFIRDRANIVGISRGVWAVDPFYRELFASLYPQWTPTGKSGRPEWYVSPVRRNRVAKGDILTRLLSLAADTLRAELSAQRAKNSEPTQYIYESPRKKAA